MKIEKVIITNITREKIFDKHNLQKVEIEQTIFEGNPVYLKTRSNKYLCIGYKNQYVTLVFNREENNAKIITAYKSSKWQIRLYKRKK